MEVNLLLPINKDKKSSIKGYWRDDKGKVYIDTLKELNCLTSQLYSILKKYKQEALFYKAKGNAYILYKNKKQDMLKNCDRFIYIKGLLSERELKTQFKRLLKKYGGFTLYDKCSYYLAEAWYK